MPNPLLQAALEIRAAGEVRRRGRRMPGRFVARARSFKRAAKETAPYRTAGIPLLGTAVNIATSLVPGGGLAGQALGALGIGGQVSNGGFQAPIGVQIPGLPVGAGICPQTHQCIGPTVAGICLGSCVPRPGAGVVPGPMIIDTGGGLIPAGGVPTGTVDPFTGQVMRAKRRRMNYSNQKALRRALRRATGYARQQKAIRKAAQEFSREFAPKRRAPRRDLPRGHVHVR